APAPREDAPEPVRPAPGPAPEGPASGAEGTPLDSLWERVLAEVRGQSRVTFTHLQQGRPAEIRDDALIVLFPGAFHAEQLSKRPEQLQRVVVAIANVFGRKLRFVPEVGEVAGVEAAAPGSAPSVDEVSVSPDELVRQGLGADLIEEMDRGG
ncbi:MAG TPA: hypothetical protein VM840_09035, partial [Actinomycetota bacterium]|nr:hypothetical protein [Actinomycetota bacterium]